MPAPSPAAAVKPTNTTGFDEAFVRFVKTPAGIATVSGATLLLVGAAILLLWHCCECRSGNSHKQLARSEREGVEISNKADVNVVVGVSDESWERIYDENSGAYYLYNPLTNETRWEEE